MSINSLMASKAYAEAAVKAASQSGAGESVAKPQGANFGDLLDGMINDAVDVGKVSEAQAITSLNGGAEMVDVVTAITAAEMTLETVVAVRDKVIEAYQNIMRMPI